MQIVFATQPFPSNVTKSLFLAGPSVRAPDQRDWRHEALSELERLDYDGHVFVPIPEERFYGAAADESGWSYDGQIAWECEGRERADAIVFWVARDIDRSRSDLGMPGFTTNFELGEDLRSGKLVFGRPASAPKNRYLDIRVRESGMPVHETLQDTLAETLAMLGDGAPRFGGECQVPLFIWRTQQFQSWYADLKTAGNRLEGASLKYHAGIGGNVFAYALKVIIWVSAEARHKSNEIVFSRRDISAVFAYHLHPQTQQVKVVLVSEFRSTVSNGQGMVFELPGGSSIRTDIPYLANAREELAEETGLHIDDLERFQVLRTRQLMSTFSSHKAVTFGVQLTDAELASLEAAHALKTTFGEAGSSERTQVHVVTVRQALTRESVDFATSGMIAQALDALGLWRAIVY
jgi:8-oxo-dGTP pyrophosphatase MutT (NUDIX family)